MLIPKRQGVWSHTLNPNRRVDLSLVKVVDGRLTPCEATLKPQGKKAIESEWWRRRRERERNRK